MTIRTPWPRRRIAAPVLALLGGVAVSQPAWGARWFDKPPVDDQETVQPRHVVTLPTRMLPELPIAADPGLDVLAASGSALVAVYGVTGGLLWSAVNSVESIATVTHEALWEVSYMLGTNGTPVPRAVFTAPVMDLGPAQEEAKADPAAATPTNAAKELLNDIVTPAHTPATDPTIEAGRMPAKATLAAIDPGLLANFIYDRGARRADGSFFVPKPLQRLFEVRTQRIASAEVPVTMSLAGRIIADPQNHGNVEASLVGRIEPPDAGLPVLGQAVRKGDILAYVVPAVGVVDRTQVRREIARLTTEIRVETESLEILKQFSFVPFRDGKIYQSEQRIAGLRREREVLLPLLRSQEVLRASADGVISASTAIAGRIVHPGEGVFTIVNPNRLWVEASAPDPTIAMSAASVRRASAATPEGQNLALTYIGAGLALREQSVPVLFRIDDPPEGLRVGRPVTITVESERHSQRGLPITRDALTIGSDGIQEVWEQSEPEVFLPHAVRIVDLDGRKVLIVDGLKEGVRVVVSGVRLLAQLQ